MSFSQVISLMHQLRNGGSLGLLLDIAVKDGVPLSFFGQPMRTSSTPARLAERYDCDIVPVRAQRLGAAWFRLTAYPPLALDANGADEEARPIAITRQLSGMMEQLSREQPDEWMYANRRWDKALYRSLGLAYR